MAVTGSVVAGDDYEIQTDDYGASLLARHDFCSTKRSNGRDQATILASDISALFADFYDVGDRNYHWVVWAVLV